MCQHQDAVRDTTDRGDTLPASTRVGVFAYLGGLMTLAALCDPNSGMMDVPVSFVLKNGLGLDASELSGFRLLAATPLYLSFLFGLARDNWSPWGLGDRGHVLMFGLASAGVYLSFAALPLATGTLLLALLLLTSSSLFVTSAQSGLASTIGQQHAMTGQISTVWNILTAFPGIVGFLAGGYLSDWLSHGEAPAAIRSLFLVGAGVSLLLASYGLLRPRAVFANLHREHGDAVRPWADLKRLARHGPARAALLIWVLWNFAPGSTTPLQYHLQNRLGASAIEWGQWNAIFFASFIPTYVLYGFLCQRVSLKRLLFWGTLVAIPQFIPLLFIESLRTALVAAVPIGLMGGVATAAYTDLLMRSAPPGLQGTTMMGASALYFVASRVGDVLGSALYDRFGSFTVCGLLTSAVYCTILLVLPRLDPKLIGRTDG